ncbi:hypothetical protein AGDE_13664 [Angomonas deanei]|nr:hypothetical protein AGDE_13664 [Angomonas deanei]|eukprot:EPY21977.1 hypothetical protein AGDE_13664 [Angomonas deanei]
MRWRWENTPRVDAAGDTAGDKSGTSGKGAKKEKKTDKGKPPPLSEEEARHLATLAALPAENIFLSDEETTPFVDFFILKGMLQHSALYHSVQTHVPPPPEHRTTTVLWEAPLTVPSLDKATLVSPVPPFILAEVNAANAASAGATSGSKGTATPPPVEEKPVEVVRSPRSALQHTIETEMAIYERRYTEECAAKGNREKAAQLEKDMTLLLEKEGSTKAAQDVYTEMEDELNTRQTRILQRVAALEKVLNIKEETPEKK